jgi:hypothetical protein
VKKPWLVVVMCAFVLPAAAQAPSEVPQVAVAEKGKILVAANGSRLGPINRIGADGSAQVIVDGRLVSIPASTLSSMNGKLTTSLTKKEVLALH